MFKVLSLLSFILIICQSSFSQQNHSSKRRVPINSNDAMSKEQSSKNIRSVNKTFENLVQLKKEIKEIEKDIMSSSAIVKEYNRFLSFKGEAFGLATLNDFLATTNEDLELICENNTSMAKSFFIDLNKIHVACMRELNPNAINNTNH